VAFLSSLAHQLESGGKISRKPKRGDQAEDFGQNLYGVISRRELTYVENPSDQAPLGLTLAGSAGEHSRILAPSCTYGRVDGRVLTKRPPGVGAVGLWNNAEDGKGMYLICSAHSFPNGNKLMTALCEQ
jgi:hypothetical protein